MVDRLSKYGVYKVGPDAHDILHTTVTSHCCPCVYDPLIQSTVDESFPGIPWERSQTFGANAGSDISAAEEFPGFLGIRFTGSGAGKEMPCNSVGHDHENESIQLGQPITLRATRVPPRRTSPLAVAVGVAMLALRLVFELASHDGTR